MIKICVSGCQGRMGKRICELALKDEEIKLVSGLERKGHPLIGREVIEGSSALIFDDLNDALKDVDVLIEFSTPQATLQHLKDCQKKISFVIGTTGFSSEEFKIIKDFSHRYPIFISPNMSYGVNVFFKICEELSRLLEGYEVEIIELHHHNKVDAPSGTAGKIAEIINRIRGKRLKYIYGRKGKTGPRGNNELGIHALRLGDIVGEHEVIFAGRGERIEIIHRAHSRDIFALGALRAVKFIKDKKESLYTMEDLLQAR